MPRFDGTLDTRNAHAWVGRELAVSDWLVVDQDRVTAFGEATLHDHWLHMDRGRAEAEGPYGGTLVQGFLLTSLIIFFTDATGLRPVDTSYNLNYGFDRVRFFRPLVTGDGVRVRDRIRLLDVTEKAPGRVLARTAHDIEADLADGIAAIAYAEWLSLWIRDDA